MTLKLMNKGYWLSTGGDYKTRNLGYPTHTGMDYCNVDSNTSVLAVAAGKVIKVINDIADPVPPKNGIDYKGVASGGNQVYIEFGNCVNRLCHMKYNSIKVKEGDIVNKGDVIGIQGNTGYSNGMHLHFEMQVNGVPVDPLPYINETVKIVDFVVPQPTPLPIVEEYDITYHRTKAGDTCYALAGQYLGDVKKWELIVEWNNLKSKNDLPINKDVIVNKVKRVTQTTQPVQQPAVPEVVFKVSDKVLILSAGNTQASGKGNPSGSSLIGVNRQIMKINDGQAYPYMIGDGKTASGWFKASALKKI